MKVTFRQSGGVALGTKVREAQADTTRLPAEEAARVTSLVEQSGILDAEGGRAPGARDAFSFELIIEADDGRVHHKVFDETTLPEHAEPLIAYLTERSHLRDVR
jgi:hypothetical protein